MSVAFAGIRPYLPLLVARHHAARAGLPAAAAEQRLEAAVMLADISGFTRLAERLARDGAAEGAEKLTRALNRHFGAYIDIIHACGGDVVKFAGDALVVAFPTEGGDLGGAGARAVTAGLRIQQWITEQPLADEEKLAVKVSVSSGDLRLAHLGGVRDRWDLMVTGPPLKEIATFSGDVEPGEVMVAPGCAPLVARAFTLEPGPAGAQRALAASVPVPVTPMVGVELTPELERALRGYVAEAVLARLDARLPGWVGELRRVSVLFINFPNATHDTPLLRADMVMRVTQASVDRFEGTFNKLSVDEKGVSMVLVWGLPPLAHEDDAARALVCALGLQTS